MTSCGHDSLPLRIPARADLRETPAGDFEILGLGGSLSPDGPHLRTTAEVLVMLLPGHRFSRETGPATGYKELFVGPAESSIATSR